MPGSNVIDFSEEVASVTLDDGLAFIARMRRQLDRFDVAVPGMQGKTFPGEYETRIRAILDELETDIHARMLTI